MNLRCAQSSKHSRGGVEYTAFLFPVRPQTSDQRDALLVIENRNSLIVIRLLLFQAGDVEVNPGPMDGMLPSTVIHYVYCQGLSVANYPSCACTLRVKYLFCLFEGFLICRHKNEY